MSIKNKTHVQIAHSIETDDPCPCLLRINYGPEDLDYNKWECCQEKLSAAVEAVKQVDDVDNDSSFMMRDYYFKRRSAIGSKLYYHIIVPINPNVGVDWTVVAMKARNIIENAGILTPKKPDKEKA